MIKAPINNKDIGVKNTYVTNNTAMICIKQKPKNMEGHIYKYILLMGDFNTSYSVKKDWAKK